MHTFFVTGTDTDVGKTLVSCAILKAAVNNGLSTAALKPVAAGVIDSEFGKQNQDVVSLASCCSVSLRFEEINPVCFPEPIAPHISAIKAGQKLEARQIADSCKPVLSAKADLTLIEGAGGWKVPLNDQETMADLVKYLNTPVILVVGMRLGCLNHALLTAQSIIAEGLSLHGWVANALESEMPAYHDNLDTLLKMMPAPLLAEIPWVEGNDKINAASRYIDAGKFIE